MPRRIFLGCLLVTGPLWAAGDFLKTVTPEELTAMGLQKLTPEELARLEAVVERYKTGEVAVGQQKRAATEMKTEAAAAPGKGPGWLSALNHSKKTEGKPAEAEVLESRLAGTLRSFSGRRNFTLENGQVWLMTETGSYAGPPLVSPALNVRPGILGTYWLQIPEAALRVRVKPIKRE